MRSPAKTPAASACCVCIWIVQAASAGPTGLVPLDDTSDAAAEAGLRSCSLYVEFDDPFDRLVGVVSSHINTDDPAGFYQHWGGTDLAPPAALCDILPLLCSDSFVTMEGHCLNPDYAYLDAQWEMCAFNCAASGPLCEENRLCGQTAGGWSYSNPAEQCAPAEQVPFLVRIGQFTVNQGYDISGVLTVVSTNNGPQDITLDFECFVCPADLNGDGNIGPLDLAALLGSWGQCPGCPADVDGDGEVGPVDLAMLLGAWGPCP